MNAVENLANLDSTIEISGYYKSDSNSNRLYQWSSDVSWRNIFSGIAPYLLEVINDKMAKFHIEKYAFALSEDIGVEPKIQDQLFNTIKVQLMAYGLVDIKYSQTTNGTMALFWHLTSNGKQEMFNSRTVKNA